MSLTAKAFYTTPRPRLCCGWTKIVAVIFSGSLLYIFFLSPRFVCAFCINKLQYHDPVTCPLNPFFRILLRGYIIPLYTLLLTDLRWPIIRYKKRLCSRASWIKIKENRRWIYIILQNSSDSIRQPFHDGSCQSNLSVGYRGHCLSFCSSPLKRRENIYFPILVYSSRLFGIKEE